MACRCTRGQGSRPGANGVHATVPGSRPASTLLSRSTASHAARAGAGRHPVPRYSAGTHHPRVGTPAACVASLVMTRRSSDRRPVCLRVGRPKSPAPGPSPGYHGPPVTTIAPNDFVHLHTHSEFSLLDGLGRITDLVDTSITPRLRLARRHRPRRALRIRRVLPGGDEGGHQADPGRRDLRRPAHDGGPRPARRQPAVPHDPAGDRPRRLSQPVPAAHRRPHRRLLLQAAHRSRAPRPLQPGPRRPQRLPWRRDPQGAGGGGLGPRAHGRRRVRRHPGQGPVLPRAPGPRDARSRSGSTSSCSSSRPRSGCRWSSPTTCTTSTRRSTTRTTSCCAWARATTSTRRTG